MLTKTSALVVMSFFLISSTALSRDALPPYDADVRGFAHVQGWGSGSELFGVVLASIGYCVHCAMGPVAKPTLWPLGQMKMVPKALIFMSLPPAMLGFFVGLVGAVGTIVEVSR